MPTKKTHYRYLQELKYHKIEVNEEYRGAHIKINHTCPVCGRKDWAVQPNDILRGTATMCVKCKHSNMAMKNYSDRLDKFGIEVIGNYINNDTKIAHKCPICHREDWLITPHNVLQGKHKCNYCSNYTISNNTYIDITKKLGVHVLDEYINSHTAIKHKCTVCGREDWMVRPNEVIKNGTRMCLDCRSSMKESTMATVLKQVFKHEYPKTIFEYDAGYRGINGGLSLYDIYVPEINTLIECQSEWHDTIDRMINDNLKMIYAIQNGYKFSSLDSRDYSILQSIQLFFPDIQEVPNYIDLRGGNKDRYQFKEAQELLDSGKTYREVASITGVNYKTFLGYVFRGEIIKPSNYKIENRREPIIVVQVNGKGNMVGKYDINRYANGWSSKNLAIKKKIIVACESTTHKYKGHYWYYIEDYERDNR